MLNVVSITSNVNKHYYLLQKLLKSLNSLTLIMGMSANITNNTKIVCVGINIILCTFTEFLNFRITVGVP